MKLAHLSLGGREDLIITHKSEVSIFPIVVIFLCGYMPGVVVLSYAVGFIYIPGKLGFVLFIIMQSYDVRK